jgi:hypothetical protein
MNPASNPWLDRPQVRLTGEAMTLIDNFVPPSLKEERRMLAEIRNLGTAIPSSHILSNGMPATTFALWYIIRRHLTRKFKAVTTPDV